MTSGPASWPLDDADRGHPHKWLILAAVSTGLILGILDASVVNIAIPALIRDLPASVGQASWVLNVYNIMQAVLFLSLGRVAERYGQRRVFVASLAVLALSSLGCGLAGNVEQLIVLRAGQAIGAAGMVLVSLIILLRAFPRRQHGLATGRWGALASWPASSARRWAAYSSGSCLGLPSDPASRRRRCLQLRVGTTSSSRRISPPSCCPCQAYPKGRLAVSREPPQTHRGVLVNPPTGSSLTGRAWRSGHE
jgi:Major Facilitator Superfamily